MSLTLEFAPPSEKTAGFFIYLLPTRMSPTTNKPGENRDMSEQEWRRFVCGSLKDGTCRMDDMQAQIEENTKITTQVQTNTAKFLEVFQAMEGGFKVLGWLGGAAKWVAAVAVAIGLIWKGVGFKWPFN